MNKKVTELLDEAINAGFLGPKAIAEWVVQQISDDMFEEIVLDLLSEAARERLRNRRTIPDIDFGPSQQAHGTQRIVTRANTRYGNPEDRLNHILSGQFFTADGWKELRNMTYDDLMYAAQWRRTQADALNGEADRLEKIAKLLHKSNKPTVGSLPREVLLRA